MRIAISNVLYRIAFRIDPREPMHFTTRRVDVTLTGDTDAIVSAVSGAIGGRVGLGFETPKRPGHGY